MNRLARWLLDKRIRRLHKKRRYWLDKQFLDGALKRDALQYQLICKKIDVLEMYEAGFDLKPAEEKDWE